VAYLAAEELYDRVDLNSRSIEGLQPSIRVSPPLDPGPIAGDVSFVAGTSDGRYVIYLATQDDYHSVELYSVDLEDGNTVRKLSPPIESGRDVLWAALTPDDARVVFAGDLNPHWTDELYIAPLDGSGPAELLAEQSSFRSPASAAGIRFSADGALAVYVAPNGLWSVPLDGSTPPLQLSGFPTQGAPSSFALMPDRVVFTESFSVAGQALYSVALDGSAAPVLLQAAGGVFVTDYRIAPDGACVVYRADALSDQVYELFRVPIDGSTPPERLNPPLVSNGNVTEFEIDPFSGRVVYEADAEMSTRFELYSVPLDASGPAIKLSGALLFGGDVAFQGLTPAGRALYVADALAHNRFELFSVPADGSAPPLVLSGVLPSGADVSELGPVLLAPGERIVYRATWGPNTALGIFVTPEDASQAPRRLDDLLDGDATAGPLAVVGGHVAFRSNQRDYPRYGLSATPLHGHSPRLLHGPFTGAQVLGMTVLGGDRLVYRANAEAEYRFELYLARMPSPPAHTGAAAPVGTRTVTRDP
jgi:hypothetical protein